MCSNVLMSTDCQQSEGMQKVKVVIPFYKEALKDWEMSALDNTMRVLSAHPVVFLKPKGLSINRWAMTYPQATIMEVSSEWLGLENGIAGYNKMMMSAAFYQLFADTEYLLICHLDAWVFRDELLQWCAAGYDLVAPPWPLRPRYTHFPLKQWLQLKRWMTASKGNLRIQMYGRIGNGGLCLRRVAAFEAACRRYAKEIAFYESKKGDSLYNEDIFWALVPEDWNYPTVETALRFAYDLKPALCHQLNRNRLPMGCHGFMHKSRMSFWKPFIPCIDSVK